MKISLFYELTTQDPDVPGAVKQRFDEALEQIRYADELGFDTVWADAAIGRYKGYNMAVNRRLRPRDPERTREAILEAAYSPCE